MFETCPTDVVAATPQIIWPLLTCPYQIARWVDAKVISAPAGPLAPGDVVTLRAGPLSIFGVRWVVGRVIEPCELSLQVELPFGVVNNEVIVITPVSGTECRVTFNWNFTFPPGWRGRWLQRLLRRELVEGPAEALGQLKQLAETTPAGSR